MFDQLTSPPWAGAGAFLVSLLTAALSLLLFLDRKKPAKKLGQLPSPPRLPFLGNLHQLGSLAHRSLTRLSQKYGPVMLLHLGRVPTVVVSSAMGAQEVMKTRDLAFCSRPYSSLTDRLFYGNQEIAFTEYGEDWRQRRRVCVLHLLSLKRANSFRWVREEEVTRLVDRVRAASGTASNISDMVIALTSDIVCRVAFGRKYTEEGESRAHTLMTELSALVGSFALRDYMPWLWWVDWLSGLDGRVRKTATQLDAFIEKVLEEHESKRCSNYDDDDDDEDEDSSRDFADILISLGTVDGFSLSRDSIKAIILEMYAAGTDTTYVTIEWAMAELIRHPREMRRAQEEIRSVVVGSNSKEKVGEEEVEGMQYLKAVIKEALRLHPPFPLLVPRESMEDTRLLGYDIFKGTRVMINAWAIGRDPESWEKAEEFWPERFLDSNIDFKGQDFQFVPFGGGRRGCPGIGFAVPTVELVLANLLYHFDWELPEGMKREEMDMSESAGITVEKKSSLVLVGKPVNH